MVPAGDVPLEGVERLPRVAPDDVAAHVHVGVRIVVGVVKVLGWKNFGFSHLGFSRVFTSFHKSISLSHPSFKFNLATLLLLSQDCIRGG